MGAVQRDVRVRGVTSNGFCGEDLNSTDVSCEQQDHQPLSPFLVMLGLCLGAFLAAVTYVVLLDAEITVYGITYFRVACVVYVMPFIISPGSIMRGIITICTFFLGASGYFPPAISACECDGRVPNGRK
jgi:hypothetical protein